jgi:hypothetical protein
MHTRQTLRIAPIKNLVQERMIPVVTATDPAPPTSSASLAWKRKLRILGGVASLQLLVQVVNALVGFMLVRMLPKSEYAWFTIIGSMSALISTLGDCGSQAGLLSIGGRVYQDRAALSRLIATGMRLRFVIVGLALVLVVPMTLYLLRKNDASWATALLLVALVVVMTGPATTSGLLTLPARLVGHYHQVQMAELGSAVCRLACSAIGVLIAPIAALGVLATSISQWLQNFILRRNATTFLDLRAEGSPQYRRELLASVRMLWFPTVFAAFQPQVATWLLSVLGTTSSVADIGALGRFAALFGLIGALIQSVVTPTFARCQQKSQLKKLLFQAVAVLVLACGFCTVVAFVYPAPFTWVLGPLYRHLSSEVGLFFVLSSLGSFTALMWAFDSSKGWVNWNWIIPPATLVIQCAIPFLMNVSTLSGALWLMILSALPPLAVTIAMAVRGLRRMPETATTA